MVLQSISLNLEMSKKLEDLFARFQKFNSRDFVGIVSCSILYLLELFVNGSINWSCIYEQLLWPLNWGEYNVPSTKGKCTQWYMGEYKRCSICTKLRKFMKIQWRCKEKWNACFDDKYGTKEIYFKIISSREQTLLSY